MALSLGWHIIISCFGIGLPVLLVLIEGRALKRNDEICDLLARRWSKALAVLFAIGAVSGTILSFELGILWPGMMGTFGEVIGLPFAIEGFAFFIEAIFIGIYIYSWDRVAPRIHWLFGLPIVISGVAAAWFVVTANAWMNQPRGFVLVDGKPTQIDPWEAIFNPATPVQTTHMILAALMVTGFSVAGVYAYGLAKGRSTRYHRIGFAIPFVLAAICTPLQIVAGDWAARHVATNQPVKLAAMEGIYQTEAGAPLTIGGFPSDGQLRYGVRIPKGLSVLVYRNPDAVIMGLDQVPRDEWPNVMVVHLSFDLMVGIGFGLLVLAVWFAFVRWRWSRLPRSRWFFRLAVIAGPAAVIALEAGWTVTEVGRQPWIVYQVMRVSDAVTDAPGIRYGYYMLLVVYTLLTVATVVALRRLARTPLPAFASADSEGRDSHTDTEESDR